MSIDLPLQTRSLDLVLENGNGFGVTIVVELNTKGRGRVEDVVGYTGDGEIVDEEGEAEHGVGGGDPQPAWPGEMEVRRKESDHLEHGAHHLENSWSND